VSAEPALARNVATAWVDELSSLENSRGKRRQKDESERHGIAKKNEND
jgi:hypothetical protein